MIYMNGTVNRVCILKREKSILFLYYEIKTEA